MKTGKQLGQSGIKTAGTKEGQLGWTIGSGVRARAAGFAERVETKAAVRKHRQLGGKQGSWAVKWALL